DVVLDVQASLAPSAAAGAPDELEANVLLGDPSLQLVIPFGPPALGLRAAASDGSVALSWDVVPGADAYDLYRSADGPGGPWALAAGPLTGTSFTDAGLQNAHLYTYALEPLSGCHPGRWSPRVTARPCSAAPPQPPANLQVIQTDCAGNVLLTWT